MNTVMVFFFGAPLGVLLGILFVVLLGFLDGSLGVLGGVIVVLEGFLGVLDRVLGEF